jgi:hypothetical protein
LAIKDVLENKSAARLKEPLCFDEYLFWRRGASVPERQDDYL